MSEAAQTLEGWYCLHDLRSVDWTAWKALSAGEREEAIAEFRKFLYKLEATSEAKEGSHSFYTVIGQKADFMLMILRPTLEELNVIETEFNKLKLAEFAVPSYSYVSVVELSNYLSSDENPYENPQIRARLFPELPKSDYICFYPMDKRREGADNWYMLPMKERGTLMRSHGMIGRKYAGLVKQVITGSVGFDDFEWGVTLYADDPLQFKKLIYEMRFDEVSARYGEFGSFFVGNLLTDEKFSHMLQVN